jgi:hypothetical protein
MRKARGESDSKGNRYQSIIEQIFFNHHKSGMREFEFAREEMVDVAKKLGIALPKNPGDILYSSRFRSNLPARIIETQPKDKAWVIELAGRAKYRFRLLPGGGRILPRSDLAIIKIPDATPEIIASYALSDEQALLAKLRYNRLIDTFLGITAYSLQNHLRTTVESLGQIEIDELYVAIDRRGAHYIVPVQAKGGSDFLSMVQASQDLVWCKSTFPDLRCRPVSAQFMSEDVIALFELVSDGEELAIAEEKHYKLVPAEDVPAEQKRNYSSGRRQS